MKKAASLIALTGVFILIFLACKKNKNNTNNTQAASTTGSTTGSSSTTPDAFFTLTSSYNVYGSSTSTSTWASATTLGTGSYLGKLTWNGDSLTYNMFYSLVKNQLISNTTSTWSLAGGGSGYAPFTYTTNKIIPVVGNLAISNSTISKSSGITISHALIAGDTIRYTITDGSTGARAVKYGVSPSTGISFTPSQLSGLATGSGASIQIEAQNPENATCGGKHIYFSNISTYKKDGLTIN